MDETFGSLLKELGERMTQYLEVPQNTRNSGNGRSTPVHIQHDFPLTSLIRREQELARIAALAPQAITQEWL